jgi:hypothetical protein
MSWRVALSHYPEAILNEPSINTLALVERLGMTSERELQGHMPFLSAAKLTEGLLRLHRARMISYGRNHLRCTMQGSRLLDRFGLGVEIVNDFLGALALDEEALSPLREDLATFRKRSFEGYLETIAAAKWWRNLVSTVHLEEPPSEHKALAECAQGGVIILLLDGLDQLSETPGSILSVGADDTERTWWLPKVSSAREHAVLTTNFDSLLEVSLNSFRSEIGQQCILATDQLRRLKGEAGWYDWLEERSTEVRTCRSFAAATELLRSRTWSVAATLSSSSPGHITEGASTVDISEAALYSSKTLSELALLVNDTASGVETRLIQMRRKIASLLESETVGGITGR